MAFIINAEDTQERLYDESKGNFNKDFAIDNSNMNKEIEESFITLADAAKKTMQKENRYMISRLKINLF